MSSNDEGRGEELLPLTGTVYPKLEGLDGHFKEQASTKFGQIKKDLKLFHKKFKSHMSKNVVMKVAMGCWGTFILGLNPYTCYVS